MASDVQYITFDNGAPRVQFPGTWDDDKIRNHLKSEEFENSMAGQGWLYKYGLDPVYLLDEENLDDNSLQAGAKSAVDTLKQIGQGALGVMYDAFGAEEKQQEAIKLVKQYQLDQAAHLWRKDKEGQVKPRFTSLEQVFESEQEFGAFLDWVGYNVGQGAVTSIPFVLAGLVSGGIGAAVMGGAARTAAGGWLAAGGRSLVPSLISPKTTLGKFGAALLPVSPSGMGLYAAGHMFGAGDTYVNQLEESDDPNAAIAFAAGIPYGLAESAFGAGAIFLNQIRKRAGDAAVKKSLQGAVGEGIQKINVKKTIKAANKGKRLKTFGKSVLEAGSGEAVAESLQEGITQTGQQAEAGKSLTELYASKDFWKQIGEAAAAGAVGGGPFGVAGGTVAALKMAPSIDMAIDATGTRIPLSSLKIDADMTNNRKAWETVDFIINDQVTVTGAGIESKVTEDKQPTSTNFNQPNANNQPTPTYNVVGLTELEGKQYFLLEGTAGKGDMFVPVSQGNQILRIDDGTIDEGKYNNSAGFQYNQEKTENVNLDSEEERDSYDLNKREWQAKGWINKNTDKDVNKFFEKEKETWVNEEENDILNQRLAQRETKREYDRWVAAGQPEPLANGRFEEFFGDERNPLSWGEVVPTIDGIYQGYDGIADEDLRPAIEKNWIQERHRRLQELNETTDNNLTKEERTRFNELGYNGPLGQKTINNMIADTTIEGKSKKTNGRKNIEKHLKNNIRFEEATKGIREREEKIIGQPTLIKKLTDQERQSKLGEDLYPESVGERILILKNLLTLLDKNASAYITALQTKTLRQLYEQKKAATYANNFIEADAIQHRIDGIHGNHYIINYEGKVVGDLSEASRIASLKYIEKLKRKLPDQNKRPLEFDNITVEIGLYEDHISNIESARTRFNQVLATFNEEPVLSTEWGKVLSKNKAIARIKRDNRGYDWEKENQYTRRYELWAKQAGQPRIKEDFANNGPKVLQTLKDILSGMALDVKVDLQEFLESDGVQYAGQYILGDRAVRVAYNAIPELRPNLNRTDSRNYILHHEVMHLLRHEGFFTQNEWLALSTQATDKWMKQYKIAERHPELTRQEQIEEAISDAFAEYMTGRYETGGVIAKVFNRLKQYLIALGNALTQNNFDTGAAIFNAIDRGVVGERYKSMERTSEIYSGGINANSIIVKQPWGVGISEGFAPRTRALFKKQPLITNPKNFYKWFNKDGNPSAVTTASGAPLVVMHTTLKDTGERFYKGPLWSLPLSNQKITSKKTARPQVARLITVLVESSIFEVDLKTTKVTNGVYHLEIGGRKFRVSKQGIDPGTPTFWNIEYLDSEGGVVETVSSRNTLSDAKVVVEDIYAEFKPNIKEKPTIILQPGTVNADIGGGQYELGTEKFKEAGVVNIVYDPFNRTREENKAAVELIKNGQADTVTLANVLNVIEEPSVQRQKLAEAFNALKVGGQAFITVHYDKNKKAGSTTMGYQHQKPLTWYLPMVKELFPTATIQNIKGESVIVATKVVEDKPMGAPFEVFDRSNDMGYHFTATQRHIDYIHQRNGKLTSDYYTFKGFLNITNPYRMNDFNVWHMRDILEYLKNDGIITLKQQEDWPSNLSDDEHYKKVVNILKDKGYDGIVYKNIGEDILAQRAQWRQPGEVPINPRDVEEELANPPQDSWIAFEPEQFKSVYNEGPYDTGNPNMFGSRQWQAAAGEKPMDEYKPMNRQQKRALDAKMGSIADVPPSSNETKNLSRFSRFIGFVREWAKDNKFFAALYDVVNSMQIKAQDLQGRFERRLFKYRAVVSDPALRELMYRAQAISQFYPNQKFTMNENGQIIFKAPMNVSDGPKDLNIEPGETIILEGDLALAYEEYQGAIDFLVEEKMKGVIAGGYIDNLRAAIRLINHHKGVTLALGWAPDLSNDITDNDIESLQHAQIVSIIKALRILRDNLKAEEKATQMVLPLTPPFVFDADSEIQSIEDILGVDGNEIPKDTNQIGLYRLASEFAKYEEWKKGDYVPLMRYGKYFVAVINKNEKKYIDAKVGEYGSFERKVGKKTKLVKHNPKYLLNYQMFENKAEAERGHADLVASNRTNLQVTVTPVSEVNIAEIKEKIKAGTEGVMDVAQYLSDPQAKIFNEVRPALEAIIAQNKNISGFDTFIVPRKQLGGVPGYSADFDRAAGQFGFMAARDAARSRFWNEALEKKATLKNYTDETNDTQLAIASDKWFKYTDDPHQEWSTVRRVGFWWYLGGNMSSAALQIFSAVQFTGPMLAQFSNTPKAIAALAKAFKDASFMLTNSSLKSGGGTFIDWDKAPADLKQVILDNMAHYLKQGQALQESGQVPGAQVFDEKKALRLFENTIIGGMFNTMEAVSRLTAFMATMRLASDPTVLTKALELYSGDELFMRKVEKNNGVLTAEILAQHIIEDTFGVYGKINRPFLMRSYGAVPALFQTYIGQMFALTYRLLTKGKNPTQRAAGRKIFARMMLMIVLTGGLFGLPGSDDAEELANWVIENAPIVGTGLKTDMRAAMREMLYDAGFSAGMINAMENGLIEAGLNMDVQRRLALGNVPGSQQVRAITGILGLSSGGNAADFAGAPGSVFITPFKEAKVAAREGRGFVEVAMKSAPLFIRNGYKAYQMAAGKGFVETNFGTVLADDPSAMEVMKQAVGFGSARMKRSREALWQERLNETRNQKMKSKFNNRITNAYRDIFTGSKTGNSGLSISGQEKLDSIMTDLYKWNSRQEIQNMIFVDLERLVQSALEASFNEIRIINSGALNVAPNLKQRKILGLN